MIRSGLIPTRRAVIDINRPCNAKCRMCYYAYDSSDWSKPIEDVKAELKAALDRGNTSVDFTGGEPTIYPDMTEAVRYAESIGLHTCIITNGLAVEKVKKLADAGCTEWLLSVHGYEDRQDQLLNVPGAWDKVNRSAAALNEKGCFVRVNCTLTRYNFKELPELARHYDTVIKPRIVNFINFNPHYEWGRNEQPEVVRRLNEVQVRASEVAPYLIEALEYLDGKHYWTNVRYFPLCLLKGYEHHVCNNPQVMFDPYEWDYSVSPKTTEAYLAQGRDFQKRINTREGSCASCGMIDVCGGLHANYAQVHGFDELEPYTERSDYPYYFKKDLATDIVIPAFRPNENLKRVLQEITDKTAPPYNVIVVSRRQSAARNRNEGLRAAQNPFVIMCDDDISDLPVGWNRQLAWILKEHREIVGISARLMNSDGTIGKNSANHFDLTPRLAEVEMIPTACSIFRRTDVRFDERYVTAGWEDSDFFMQLRQKYGGNVAIANEIRVVHLNEEKEGGGYWNQQNKDLFFAKWVDGTDKGGPVPVRSAEARAADCESSRQKLQPLHEAALRTPGDMAALKALIRASYDAKQFDQLEDCLRQLLQDHPRAKELRFLLASCLFEQGRYEEAHPIAEQLHATDPAYSPVKTLTDQIRVRLAAKKRAGTIGQPKQQIPAAKPVEPRPVPAVDRKATEAVIPGPRSRMKILLGPGLFDPRGNEAFLVKSLKRAADVVTFDHTRNDFDAVLRDLPAGWTPDAVLIRDAEYYKIPPGLERAEMPVFCLLGDYNLSFNQMLPVMGAFDHFFCDLKGVRIFGKLGFKNCGYFCLYGYDPDLHRDYSEPKRYDVLFIGNLNHAVQQERAVLLHRLGTLGKKYRVHIGTNVFGEEYGRMLNSASLVFNRPIREEANMRFFEGLGCGALVMNPHIEELDLLGFRPGEHYLPYGDVEETIREYFERWPEERKRDAGESVRRVLAEHSYDRRAEELVRKMGATEVRIADRGLRRLSREEVRRRWVMHHSEKLNLAGVGDVGRFDPMLVGWETELVNKELRIDNFDFTMWFWWMNLLAASGRHAYLKELLDEKEQVLGAFNCYGEIVERIRGWKNNMRGVNVAAAS
ncbi:MAG: radical SAM protein [Desulfobacteraceae bacterium]|nr:radical SAM protein [Desulfobacteraceae bacterium]